MPDPHSTNEKARCRTTWSFLSSIAFATGAAFLRRYLPPCFTPFLLFFHLLALGFASFPLPFRLPSFSNPTFLRGSVSPQVFSHVFCLAFAANTNTLFSLSLRPAFLESRQSTLQRMRQSFNRIESDFCLSRAARLTTSRASHRRNTPLSNFV